MKQTARMNEGMNADSRIPEMDRNNGVVKIEQDWVKSRNKKAKCSS